MNLYESIFVRKSVRKYKMNLIDDEVFEGFESFMDQVNPLYSEIQLEYQILTREEVVSFSSIPVPVKAPYYMIVTSEEKPNYLLNVGYFAQQGALYLAAKGYGTCFIGMIRPKKDVILKNHKYVIALAFGEGEEDVYRISDTVNRLPSSEIAVFKSDISQEIKNVIQAGRFAPSAINGQPWRFVVYHNRIHIFCKKNFLLPSILHEMKSIDLGICIANMFIAAEELWIDAKILSLDKMESAYFKKYEYVASLKLQV